MNFHPYITPYVKINSKWIIELYVTTITKNLPEENMGKNLDGFGSSLDRMSTE